MIVVYAYVCGDIIHKGHLLYLESAKNLGDKLIVGVLTDKAIEERKKTPIISFDERCYVVKNLKMVDVVIAQETYSPIINILITQPDIIVESESHDTSLISEVANAITCINCRMVILPYFADQSSTAIKKKIKEEKVS